MNNDDDLFKEFNLTKRRPLNIIHNLIGREQGTNSSTLRLSSLYSGQHRNELTRFNHLKKIYLAVTPNYTVISVKTPSCYLRRFSPDGRYLVAFNQNLNGIQIFSFKGSSAGIEEIQKFSQSYNNNQSLDSSINSPNSSLDRTDFENPESFQFRLRAFDTYFKELANLKLIDNNELINRECTLFYKNSYLIVASSEVVSEDNLPPYDQLAANNESLHYGHFIENYTIYLVNLTEKKLCDSIKFRADKLNLTHNQSLCLFKNTFTVLSHQNQTIYVYNIVPCQNITKNIEYKFVLIQQIGRFCYPDDSDFIHMHTNDTPSFSSEPTAKKQARMNLTRTSSVNPTTSNYRTIHHQKHNSRIKPFNETCFTGMKQRIMTFFYNEAVEKNLLSQFYANLNTIINLKMYKMQMLDTRHILIKYVNSEHIVNQKTNNISINTSTAAFNSGNQSNSGQANNSTTPSTPYTLNFNPISNTNTGSSNNSVTPISTNNNSSIVGNSAVASTSSINSSFSPSNMPTILNEQYTPFYFVLYDIKEAKILNILRNTSTQLVDVYESLQDYFSLTAAETFTNRTDQDMFCPTFNFHTLPSNNIYANQILQRQIKNLSKLNNNTDLTKCILSELPLNSQSYTSSPYLDHNLFSYDMKLISNFDRPKSIGDQVVKFNNRDTGRFSFRMYPGKQNFYTGNNYHPHPSMKRLVAFIWHPYEPFCISVQRTTQEYNVNFHVYSKINLI